MALTPTIRVLERCTILCPFGVRFHDSVERRSIGEGLRVIARPKGRDTSGSEAFLTRSDVFAFQNLAGLPNAGTRRFVITVEDTWQRFLPFSFEADLPGRGLFELPCLRSPPSLLDVLEASVPLFSSPARPV